MKYLSVLILSLLLIACGDKPGTPEPAKNANSGNETAKETNTNENTGKENAPAPNPNTEEAPCACTDIWAFVPDKGMPGEDLEQDAYDAPNGKSVEKFKNRVDDMEVMLQIKASKDEWMQVGADGDLPNLDGKWLEPGSLTGGTRNYGGQEINLYKEQSTDSEVLHTLRMETFLGLYGCCGNWIYVKGRDADLNEVEGWMDKEMWCSNPVTNCN